MRTERKTIYEVDHTGHVLVPLDVRQAAYDDLHANVAATDCISKDDSSTVDNDPDPYKEIWDHKERENLQVNV